MRITRLLLGMMVLTWGCVTPPNMERHQGPSARGSVVTKADFAESPGTWNVRMIYYDDSFLWMSRNFGDETFPTEPALFVHSKKHEAWRRIVQISTAGGKFGKSYSENPDENSRLRGSQVGWDFSPLADQPWADIPLRTGGSITFPDKVEFDAASGRYKLSFMSVLKIDPAVTVLWVRKKDLMAEFGRTDR